MKRALATLLVLTAACSGSTPKAAPTATPTTVPPSASASAEPSATPTPTPTPTAGPVGPVGTRVPSGFVPSSASFVSDATGWVLGSSPCPSGKGRCDVIARTRDGGGTWRAIPSPATSPDHLAQIRFADDRNGYVSGDDLWATHDGGATWKVVPDGGSEGLATAAGRVWYLADAYLYSAPVSGGRFVQEQTGGHAAAFWLQGDSAVYSVGENAVAYALRHQGLPRQIDLPCQDSELPVLARGVSHWLLVCEGDAGLGHQGKHAYRSEDQGKTWQPSGDPPQVVGSDLYVTRDGDFVIDHQQVAVYREGSWEPALTSDGGLSEGGFESARLGFCIGGFDGRPDQAMKITHDAGRTWKTVTF